MQELIGRTLGHYELVEQIGAGGMGVVFRAHDDRLDRDVAIKVLPEEFARNSDRLARFEREAKAVAALSHPNILEIFDFDTEGEIAFAVTELLEGETLREHLLIAGGPLPWKRVQEIGVAVANGLGAAHGKAVVHRDIKPSNIFICSDGRVKILDFGLAASRESADPDAETKTVEPPLTGEGKVLGTVGYMSPEQVRAEQTDHRSDIFSLGCVLYEMLTGQRPFRAPSSAEIMAAIAREDPPGLSRIEPEILPSLERVVNRCLEKRPEDRFQSSNDLAFNLQGIHSDSDVSRRPVRASTPKRRMRAFPILVAVVVLGVAGVIGWRASRSKPEETSLQVAGGARLDRNLLVIVPFENRTGDPDLDGLGLQVTGRIADGLRGQTIERLIASLSVEIAEAIATSDTASLIALASAHGAATVLSGSYSRQGMVLRFEMRLTDAKRGRAGPAVKPVVVHPDAPDEGIEALRDRVRALAHWFLSTNHNMLSTPSPPSWEALQAKAGAVLRVEGIPRYRRALEIDPDFHSIWFNIAICYQNSGMWPEALEALDTLDAHPEKLTPYGRHVSAAERAEINGQWAMMRNHILRAGQAVPRADLRTWLAGAALALGRPDETIELLGARLAEDTGLALPWGYSYYTGMADAFYMKGMYERVVEISRQGREEFPDVASLLWAEARGLAALGRLHDLGRLTDDCQTLQFSDTEGTGKILGGAVDALRRHGYREEALNTAGRAIEWYRRRPAAETSTWEHRRGLADALYRAERWEEARNHYLLLADEAGDVRDVLRIDDIRPLAVYGRLGTVAARLGDQDEAERISAMLEPVAGFTWGDHNYYRACIAALLGQRDLAIQSLKQALAGGFRVRALFSEDPDLEPLWNDPQFQELLRPKG